MQQKQLNMTDIAVAVKRKRQERCKHDFIIVQDIDTENDRVYERAICRKCSYEIF